jgi:hypothetical protein
MQLGKIIIIKNVGMKKKLDRLRLDFLAGSVEPAKNRLMGRRRLATITVNRQKQKMGSISLSCLNNYNNTNNNNDRTKFNLDKDSTVATILT